MDGIHDVGGMHGFGRVSVDEAEPVFHQRWEAKVFAMSGLGFRARAWYNSDQFRHAVERIQPVAYLTHGYYGRWLGGIETLLVEAGLITQEDLTARAVALGADPGDLIAARPKSCPDPLGPVPDLRGTPRSMDRQPRFKLGDRVRTSTRVIESHTRLPRYARGKAGVICRNHQGWVYPDSSASGQGEDPQYLYTVAFSGAELWGTDADPGLSVHLDLFEPYLFPLSPGP